MPLRSLIFAVVLSLGLTLSTGVYAQADDEAETSTSPVQPDFKGIVGLGLIGAELGFVLPAVTGLHETWAFIVFPLAGAAGGGVAGYFLLEKGEGHPELAVASLATGMALFIPAMLVTLSATAYTPEDSAAAKERLELARPGGLVRLNDRGASLGSPSVTMSSMSAKEALRTGAVRDRELSLSVLSGAF
jgi:hypothetical protein